MSKGRVAVADTGDSLDSMRRQLVELGYEFAGAVRGIDDLAAMNGAAMPDVALVRLPGQGEGSGASLGHRLRELGVAVVYVTDGDPCVVEPTKDTGPLGYVVEPVDPRQLDLAVWTAMSMLAHRHRLASSWSESVLHRSLDDMSLDEADRIYRRMRLLETVFDSVADGLIVADAKGNHVALNRRAMEIAGPLGDVDPERRAASYGLYMPDGETLCEPEQLPMVRALNDEPTDDFPMVVRNPQRPEGVEISVSARPLHDADGAVNGAVVVIRDVTDVRRAQAELGRTTAELREQTAVLEDILNTISDGIVVADQDGNFTVFNPSAERIVGMGSSDVSPEHWSEHYGLFYADQVTEVPPEELPLMRAINGVAVDEMELFVRNPYIPDGAFINVNARPMQDAHGNPKGGVATFRDVTAHHRADEALSRAFAQGRLEVLDTILHNIGNAINSVATGVGTLGERLKDQTLGHRFGALADAMHAHRDDLAEYLTAHPQGRQALPFIQALVTDFGTEREDLVATLERVENRVGHIVDIIRTQRSFVSGAIERKELPPRQAIADAVNMLQDSLDRRDIAVTVDCSGAPEWIRVEESRFNQMLVNLVRNALEAIDERRAAEGRSVEASVRIVCYSRSDYLVIDVIDNGIGIPEARLKSIFSPGYTTKPKGSGLGLHSIMDYVVGNGGRIEPMSDGPGKGATMRVLLRQVQ